jgi:multisubunit Na+/H+ antiporter MnhB subunit
MKLRPRLTNEQIKARLILAIGIGLTAVFVCSIGFMLYGLLFITQPREMAEADREIFSLLSPMMMSLSGILGGALAANGLRDSKDKPKDSDA